MSAAEVNQTYTHRRRETYVVAEVVTPTQVYYRIKFTKRRRWIDRARFEREWKATATPPDIFDNANVTERDAETQTVG